MNTNYQIKKLTKIVVKQIKTPMINKTIKRKTWNLT